MVDVKSCKGAAREFPHFDVGYIFQEQDTIDLVWKRGTIISLIRPKVNAMSNWLPRWANPNHLPVQNDWRRHGCSTSVGNSMVVGPKGLSRWEFLHSITGSMENYLSSRNHPRNSKVIISQWEIGTNLLLSGLPDCRRKSSLIGKLWSKNLDEVLSKNTLNILGLKILIKSPSAFGFLPPSRRVLAKQYPSQLGRQSSLWSWRDHNDRWLRCGVAVVRWRHFKVCGQRDTTRGEVLKGHFTTVYSVEFSPNRTRIMSSSWDNTVRIWSAVTGEIEWVLEGHSDRVSVRHMWFLAQRIRQFWSGTRSLAN